MDTPTREYSVYEQAYDYFNAELFSGQLPPCLITLQRKAKTLGYYSPKRFVGRNHSNNKTDEIALNPDTFSGQSDKDILSTLVHEMVHLWQEHFGKPGRRRYHNREWVHHMLTLGLQPVSFDQLGKMTGQVVSHKIAPGGWFDVAAEQLLSTGFCLSWQSQTHMTNGISVQEGEAPLSEITREDTSPVSKVKYTCPVCTLNAWAKPNVALICGKCKQSMSAKV